jgi:hypothetical protein
MHVRTNGKIISPMIVISLLATIKMLVKASTANLESHSNQIKLQFFPFVSSIWVLNTNVGAKAAFYNTKMIPKKPSNQSMPCTPMRSSIFFSKRKILLLIIRSLHKMSNFDSLHRRRRSQDFNDFRSTTKITIYTKTFQAWKSEIHLVILPLDNFLDMCTKSIMEVLIWWYEILLFWNLAWFLEY